MKKAAWIFETTPKMGGATGEAFTNTLLATGMNPASTLAREAIQNSVDAAKPGSQGKVSVAFRRVSIDGQRKTGFVKALSLNEEFLDRYEEKVLELQQDHCLAQLGKPSKPIDLMYVEDRGTHGLFGSPHDSSSHFFKLLLSLGDSSKSRGSDASGGSYGYGKSVYSSNSRIRTIVAYSVFDPKNDKSRKHARLMGCAYFRAHEHQGREFSGRAWFGIAGDDVGIVDPLDDEAAHDAAVALGFERRAPGDTGTSILIVDSGVTCDELRTSVEDWWWPRMLDESIGLDVRLYDQGKVLAPPRPRMRADLKPFIHCYEMAIERSAPLGKQDKTNVLRLGSDALGKYGFTVIDEKEGSEDVVGTERTNAIALIRGARMVVCYLPVGGAMPLPCVGSFVASPDVDRVLKLSEPAAHDKWDHKSARLQTLPGDNSATVKTINERLRAYLRKFSSEAAPPVPKQELRLKSLERLLGNMFAPPTKGAGGGGYGADPIEIRFIEQPQIKEAADGLSTAGSFRVGIADEADRSRVEVEISVECLVVEDEGVSKDDPIGLTISTKETVKRDPAKPGTVRMRLAKGDKPLFRFKTSTYPTDWTTQTRVSVKEVA